MDLTIQEGAIFIRLLQGSAKRFRVYKRIDGELNFWSIIQQEWVVSGSYMSYSDNSMLQRPRVFKIDDAVELEMKAALYGNYEFLEN